MPLTEQNTHHDAVKIIALLGGLGGIVWAITRSTLPHSGDNIHHLPHGGLYRDGNKCISYNSPGFPSHSHRSGAGYAFLVVLLISLCILVDAKFRRSISSSICSVCSNPACEATGGRLHSDSHRGKTDYSKL